MTIHLVIFSDESMSRSAELCVESAMRHGANCGLTYSPTGIASSDVVQANPKVFTQPPDQRRAWGWWAWKPLIVSWWMENADDGDVLIYADAGIEFINNVNYIIDRMDQDIFLFGNQWEHAHWCKRDIVDEVCSLEQLARLGHGGVWLNESSDGLNWGYFGKQVQASVIFFRVSDYSRKFAKEWLDWCLFEGGRLIDDSPSRAPNHPEFQENRHDQAILTTLAYRDGVRLHWWPAQYNDGAFIYERGDYPDEGYPVMFHHHRKRNHEWPEKVDLVAGLDSLRERFTEMGVTVA